MVITLHVDRRDGEHLALQTAEDGFFDVLGPGRLAQPGPKAAVQLVRWWRIYATQRRILQLRWLLDCV
jgi:hypothetical protein